MFYGETITTVNYAYLVDIFGIAFQGNIIFRNNTALIGHYN